jgi:hypothetical protein
MLTQARPQPQASPNVPHVLIGSADLAGKVRNERTHPSAEDARSAATLSVTP